MEQLKTGISEIDNKLGNPSDDKFLFVFSPEVEEDCLCGLSQKMTVRIISIIALLSAITSFLSALGKSELLDMIIDIIFSAIFIAIAFFSFYSTINLKYEYANVGYLCYSILWIISFFCYCYKSLKILFAFLNIFGKDFLTEGISYIFTQGIILAIYLYFIWILYCFTINLKKGKSM